MNRTLAIMHGYPEAISNKDFYVYDNNDGEGEKLYWNLKDDEGNLLPEPTDEELAAWYEEWETAEATKIPTKSLEQLIEELSIKMNYKDPHETFISLDIENTDLETLRQAKLDQLDYLCTEHILSGFESDCLGTIHTYPFKRDDQDNMMGRLANIIDNPTLPKYQQFPWKTKEFGPVTHTQEQFRQLCKDADDHKDGSIAKYWTLKIQTENATTKEEIILINWEEI